MISCVWSIANENRLPDFGDFDFNNINDLFGDADDNDSDSNSDNDISLGCMFIPLPLAHERNTSFFGRVLY